ncbi:hypothetical protein GGF31_002636 [Allomyces arbusculus]|nr:hypothetical protein GGF31_002636 [Allomyces arbusculus]
MAPGAPVNGAAPAAAQAAGTAPSADLLALQRRTMANDAIAAAAFNEKKWLWVPHATDGYKAAWVVQEPAAGTDQVTVQIRDDKECVVNINDTQKMNPPKFDKAEDMADLAYLNEASVVHNLRERYFSNLIYTYSGLFLVAVNPYHRLPIYSENVILSYQQKKRAEMPPHVYAVTDAAYRALLQDRESQSILITGESGAGKTENTKKVIQYLAYIAGEKSANQAMGTLEQQILQANPILESFGNAQTIRNNNSSRFGKFVRIEFSASGQIAGANIERYLLEKSRVTHQTAKERSYHIFYQLVKGASPDLKKQLLLDAGLNDYNFIKSSNKNIEGVDDVADFAQLQEAMSIMGFSKDEQVDLFRAVAAVLLLGNITTTGDRENQAQLTDPLPVEKVCHVLGVPVPDFTKGLLKPRIKAGRDWVTQARSPDQVANSLEALARSLYERMFGRLVDRINAALDQPTAARSKFIGVLDIAGFEIFDVNSFEQLCINYTNERLQQFFNHHMFILEQEEYRKEGIEWKFIDFGLDLQPTIDLIEKANPIGILSCLDEECVMPKATDKTFTDKLHTLWKGKSAKYETPRFQEGFIIHHYAGKVEYKTSGWLDKNKDPLNENVTRLIANSSDKYLASLFADYLGDGESGTGLATNGAGAVAGKAMMVKKGAFRTVAQKHKEQLVSLMATLYDTTPHFVRCIIPNEEKRPGKLHVPLVLDQLRCNGVLEGIRICRAGFPNRLVFAEFRQRYEIICPGLIPRGFMDGRKATQTILEHLAMDQNQYRIGSSKVFFRAGVLAELEEIRDAKLSKILTGFQAQCRGFLARKMHRKRLDQVKAIRIVQRNARIYVQLREWPWWKLYAKVKPLLQVGRVDDELRRKDEALGELKDQIAHQQAERDRLEAARAALEAEKRQTEDLYQSTLRTNADQAEILARAQQRLAALQDELDVFNKEYSELEKSHEDMTVQKLQLEAKVKEASEQLAEEKQVLAHLEKERVIKDARMKQLETELAASTAAMAKVEAERKSLAQTVADFERQVSTGSEREAELLKQKKKLESTVQDLDERSTKQELDLQALTSKKNTLESELANLRTSLGEAQRTKSELEAAVKKRESEIETLTASVRSEAAQAEQLDRLRRELVAKVAALEGQVEQERSDKERSEKARRKLETEFEDLRHVVEDKNDQETKQSDLRRLRETELSDLRAQLQAVQQELEEAKRKHAASMDALRRESDGYMAERDALAKQKQSLEKKTVDLQNDLDESLEARNKIDKVKRQLDADLSATRAKTVELEDRIAELRVAKEGLEKQVAATATRIDESESKADRIDKERGQLLKQLEGVREELEDEVRKRTSAEAQRKKLQAEVADWQSKFDAQEIQVEDVQRRLLAKQQELEALKDKYAKDATERGAELEESRKKLEREVADLRAKLAAQEQVVTNLEKAKVRLTTEVEDLRMELEREHAVARQAEKLQKQTESDLAALNTVVDAERRARELAESKCRTLQGNLDTMQMQVEDKQQAFLSLQRSKNDLESELKTLINEIGDGGKNVHELERSKKKLEAQLAELTQQLEEEEAARKKAEEQRRRTDEQFTEYRAKSEQELVNKEAVFEETRKLYQREINSLGMQLDDEQAARNELQKVKVKLEEKIKELSSKEDSSAKSKTDLEKLKKKAEQQLREVQQQLEAEERARRNFEEMAQRHEKKSSTLQAEIERLEQALEASDRERKKAEKRIEELTNELEGGEGGSKVQLLEAKKKLEKDLVRLREELEQEQELRQHLEAQRREGLSDVEAIRGKVTSELEEKIEKLEESRRALLASQRLGQQELEHKQRDMEALEKQKRMQQSEIEQLKERLEQEITARNEEAAQRRKLAQENKDLQTKLEIEVAKSAELTESSALFKNRADTAIGRLEASEMARLKAEKSEGSLKLQLKELDESLAELSKDKKQAEDKLRSVETQLAELSERAEEDAADLADAQMTRRKLAHEIEEERDRHKREMDEREGQLEQFKRKYQAQIKDLASELDMERRNAARLKEDLNTLEADNVQLSTQVEEEQRAKLSLFKEKERLEAKAADISRQYAEALSANDDYQNQITKHIAQIREVRAQLLEVDAQRAVLEKTKKTLDARIEELSEQYVECAKAKSTAQNALASLEQEALHLRLTAEESDERAQLAQDKLSKSELALQQAQAEVARHRDLASDADRARLALEKQVKEMTLRVMELEAAALGDVGAKATARSQARVDELAAALDKEMRDREEANRNLRRVERSLKDAQAQLTERDRIKQRADEETEKLEAKCKKLKQQLDEMEANEANLQLAKRRLERELQDSIERGNRLESESKRLKARAV